MPERYGFILKQRELAYRRLKEAQDVVNYMEQKVRHYEDIISHIIPDDTNMADKKNLSHS